MKKREESGTVIMEAVMIFPMVILTIILLLTVGNGYYQRSRVEAIVQTDVINACATSADELLRYTVEHNAVPQQVQDAPEFTPYKYLFARETTSLVGGAEDATRKKIQKLGTGYFKGMEVKNLNVTFDYKNHFGLFRQVFENNMQTTVPDPWLTEKSWLTKTDVTYDINLPISLFGINFKMQCSSHIEVPVSDSPEFIRNVDMVIDYLERWKAYNDFKKNYDNMLGKVSSFFG